MQLKRPSIFIVELFMKTQLSKQKDLEYLFNNDCLGFLYLILFFFVNYVYTFLFLIILHVLKTKMKIKFYTLDTNRLNNK